MSFLPKGIGILCLPNLCAKKKLLILCVRKNWVQMLMKSTLGDNFINVLQAVFMPADTKSTNKTVKSSSFFALSRSASVKTAHRALVKLTLGDVITNTLTSWMMSPTEMKASHFSPLRVLLLFLLWPNLIFVKEF